MEAGAHVFVEKPLALTVESAQQVVETAKRTKRKLVIGYILRHHPSWTKFVEIARQLGTPLVFRMNLNQQSTGENWEGHKRLLESFSPIVDCGVHYVDIMCQMTPARPTRVHALGAHLSTEVSMYNYGMLQVAFDDGSVGWYEAGWGPMMSETAFFVKDVIGPKGSVSIVMAESAGSVKSDDINAHTKTNQILWHHADPARSDERIDMTDEPDHDALCEREQRFLLKAIDWDLDLTEHMDDGVKSLRIVLAADESVRDRAGRPPLLGSACTRVGIGPRALAFCPPLEDHLCGRSGCSLVGRLRKPSAGLGPTPSESGASAIVYS